MFRYTHSALNFPLSHRTSSVDFWTVTSFWLEDLSPVQHSSPPSHKLQHIFNASILAYEKDPLLRILPLGNTRSLLTFRVRPLFKSKTFPKCQGALEGWSYCGRHQVKKRDVFPLSVLPFCSCWGKKKKEEPGQEEGHLSTFSCVDDLPSGGSMSLVGPCTFREEVWNAFLRDPNPIIPISRTPVLF